jgi:HK97 gp10 family phage protein
MAETVKWKGFRELEQNLKLLGGEMREKGVKLMMSKASVPMRNDAKSRAPVLKEPDPRRRPGALRDAVRMWRHRKSPYAVTYYIGVPRRRGLKKDSKDDAFYWLWQEFGSSKQRPANGNGFLRPAFESKKLESVRVALDTGRSFVMATANKFKRIR